MQGRLCAYYSSIRQKQIDWLWFPYIPYGKITVLQGDPGEGKSTFILRVAALLSKGLPMPDGFGAHAPKSVIYQCAEDSLADTIKPRLVQAGADCSRIAYIVDAEAKLTLEDERIERALQETNARLLVIDPIQAFLAQEGDLQNAMRMRAVLGRLAGIAERYQCAVVLVGHMNKGAGGKDLYRGLGSIDIAAVSRSILMIARDKNDPHVRYMLPVKSSLAPEGCAIGFTLGGESGFSWIGQCEVDVDELAKSEPGDSLKADLARRYLLEQLSEREMPCKEVLARLQLHGIAKRTVLAAKKDMRVMSFKKGDRWYWKLPDETRVGDEHPPDAAKGQRRSAETHEQASRDVTGGGCV